MSNQMSKSDAARIQSSNARNGSDMSSGGFAACAQSAAARNNNARAAGTTTSSGKGNNNNTGAYKAKNAGGKQK